MSKIKQKDNAKETPKNVTSSEQTEEDEDNNNKLENVEPGNPGFWVWILSFFRESENTANPKSPSVQDNLQPSMIDAGTRRKKLWLRRARPAVEEEISAAPQKHEEKQTINEVKSAKRESEGFGSYYMPCCPCSGHLDDQPCMPKWCFSYKYIDWMTVVALITCFCWGTVYSVHPTTASPRGALFTQGVVTILAYAAGHASAYFLRLPPSLFMFVVGFAFRNSPVWDNTSHFAPSEVEAAKALILTIMSTKAAIYFDGKIFLEYPLTILILGIVPCLGEIFVVGGIIYAISGLDLATSYLTATVLANVSSVVISHSLVTLAKKGYGDQTGIISILMAAAPIDGIIVLFLLGILVMRDKQERVTLITTLGEQLAGIVLGALTGAFLAFVPTRNNANATLQRTIMHVLSIMCVQLLCHALGFLSVGHLFNTAAACATVNLMSTKKWTLEVMMLKDTFEMIWHLLQPAAVILVCCIVDFSDINPEMLWQSFLVFFASYVMRISLVLLGTQFSGKPIKQRILMSLCWTARGLTQGIMAGTLLAFVAKSNTPQKIRDVLTIFTVDLIAGNVIGALQISFLGPILLPQNDPVSKA